MEARDKKSRDEDADFNAAYDQFMLELGDDSGESCFDPHPMDIARELGRHADIGRVAPPTEGRG